MLSGSKERIVASRIDALSEPMNSLHLFIPLEELLPVLLANSLHLFIPLEELLPVLLALGEPHLPPPRVSSAHLDVMFLWEEANVVGSQPASADDVERPWRAYAL